MLKEYIKTPSVKEEVGTPKQSIIDSLLNYSKSLEVKQISNQKIILNLN